MAKVQGTKKYWEDKGKVDLRKNKALTPVESGLPITSITLDLTKSCNLACDYCNPAGTPILMADLTYKPIEEVKTGDKVIGFIIPEEKDKHTYFTIATIEGTAVRESDIVKVKTTNGDFRCTPDHKWFNGRSYTPARIGMDIKYVSDPIYFKETDDYKLGYIHGMMAGDGAFSEGKHIYKDGPQKGNTNIYHHFRLALNDIEAIDRTERYINELNLGIIHRFQYTEKMTGLRSGSRDLFNKAQGFPSDDSSDEYIKGWAAGIFDAEGSYDGSNLRIAQLEGEVLDSIVYSFTRLNFDIKLEDYRDVKAVRINNGFQSVVKFFAMCNPAISRKRERVLVGKGVYGNSVVIDIIPDGYEKVYSLQTSTGNYVAHGHTSKNCFTNLSKGKYCTSDLTEEMGKKVIDWLMDKGTRGNSKRVDITFWGGEPLLKWDMMQTLVLYAEEKAKENDISVSFNGTTNVTLLTPEKFDFLEKHNLYFLLSVDGRQEHHDMHRVFKDGTGSWSLVDKNINAILERWPHYNVRASYSTETIETFLDDIKYLYNKGFRTIAYSPVSEGDWTEEKVKTLHKVWRDITDWYIECYNNGDPVKLKFLDDACRREVMPDGNHAPCGAGRGYVGVTTDGAFYPCHRFNKFNDDRPWWEKYYCLGHIDYGVLNQEFRENFTNWDTKESMQDSCKECKAFETHCTGGCWASSWDVCDDLAGLPIASCESTLSNMDEGKYIKENYPEIFDKIVPKRRTNKGVNKIPEVQGCQCYNINDILWGRIVKNNNDEASCLCNMSTYGDNPKQIDKCTCYNIEDNYMTFYDKREAQCGRFTKDQDPVNIAIEYLKKANLDIEKLSENQKEQIDQFASLLEINKELENLRKD